MAEINELFSLKIPDKMNPFMKLNFIASRLRDKKLVEEDLKQ